MSQGDMADPLSPWLDINSLDIQPLSEFDPCFDDVDDQYDILSGQSSPIALPSPDELFVPGHLPGVKRRRNRRNAYGEGIDALGTRPYRHYPIAQSPIVHEMQERYGFVTNQMLRNLIGQVMAHAPENARPRPPTRNQRRAKGGLVAWIDENSAFVMAQLRCRITDPFP
jgi:hypothetical protein